MPRSRALPILTLLQLVSASCSMTKATLAFLLARESLTGFFISAVYISISSTVKLSSSVSAAGQHSQPAMQPLDTVPNEQLANLRPEWPAVLPHVPAVLPDVSCAAHPMSAHALLLAPYSVPGQGDFCEVNLNLQQDG